MGNVVNIDKFFSEAGDKTSKKKFEGFEQAKAMM